MRTFQEFMVGFVESDGFPVVLIFSLILVMLYSFVGFSFLDGDTKSTMGIFIGLAVLSWLAIGDSFESGMSRLVRWKKIQSEYGDRASLAKTIKDREMQGWLPINSLDWYYRENDLILVHVRHQCPILIYKRNNCDQWQEFMTNKAVNKGEFFGWLPLPRLGGGQEYSRYAE